MKLGERETLSMKLGRECFSGRFQVAGLVLGAGMLESRKLDLEGPATRQVLLRTSQQHKAAMPSLLVCARQRSSEALLLPLLLYLRVALARKLGW